MNITDSICGLPIRPEYIAHDLMLVRSLIQDCPPNQTEWRAALETKRQALERMLEES